MDCPKTEFVCPKVEVGVAGLKAGVDCPNTDGVDLVVCPNMDDAVVAPV